VAEAGSQEVGGADVATDVPKPVVERRLPLPCRATLPTGFCLVSDMGDFIGGGMNVNASGPASVTVLASTQVNVARFDLEDTVGTGQWNAEFAAGSMSTLAPGLFDPAMRYPFQTGGRAGLSIDGNGRGCNMLTGKFSVEELARSPDQGITRFSATFEQHCEGGVPALRGVVNFQATGMPDPSP
jgi:hypothetical protein